MRHVDRVTKSTVALNSPGIAEGRWVTLPSWDCSSIA